MTPRLNCQNGELSLVFTSKAEGREFIHEAQLAAARRADLANDSRDPGAAKDFLDKCRAYDVLLDDPVFTQTSSSNHTAEKQEHTAE